MKITAASGAGDDDAARPGAGGQGSGADDPRAYRFILSAPPPDCCDLHKLLAQCPRPLTNRPRWRRARAFELKLREMPCANEKTLPTFRSMDQIRQSGRDVGVDLVLHFDGRLTAYQMKTGTHTGPYYWLPETAPSAEMRPNWRHTWLPRFSPSWLTGTAVFLAGRKRSVVRDEWRSHLYGWPGRGLSRQDQLRAAWGFLWSAIRFRLQDAADLGWRPVDAVLQSRTLSNLLIWGSADVMLVAIVRHDGRFGLVADAQDPIAVGAFLYCVIKAGRQWRRVKPPEHKPRRDQEQ